MFSHQVTEQKIRLENGIFAQAQYENVAVLACGGRLCAARGSALLQGWVRVYNRLFADENARFIATEIAQTSQYYRCLYEQYMRQQQQNPPAYSFCLITEDTMK